MDEDYLDTEEGGEIASRAAREALEMTDNDQNREEQAAGLNQQVCRLNDLQSVELWGGERENALNSSWVKRTPFVCLYL